jgi:RNA polymerase sigma-70 factor (ECF subfamily)
VRAGLEPSLALCARFVESPRYRRRPRAGDLPAGDRARRSICPRNEVDRWLLAILRSIWLNEVRARRIREGGGFVAAEDALTSDGAHEIEINITASAVIRSIGQLPEAQRETVLLVYGEGYSYSEAAAALTVPIGTVMSRLAAARATLAKLDSSQSHPARAAFGG